MVTIAPLLHHCCDATITFIVKLKCSNVESIFSSNSILSLSLWNLKLIIWCDLSNQDIWTVIKCFPVMAPCLSSFWVAVMGMSFGTEPYLKILLLFSLSEPLPLARLLLCVFSPGEWLRGSCNKACAARLGWRAAAVGSDVGSLGLRSHVPDMQRGGGDGGLVWTCPPELRGRESGSVVHPEALCVCVCVCVCHVSICLSALRTKGCHGWSSGVTAGRVLITRLAVRSPHVKVPLSEILNSRLLL